jgi:hypothetical protein
MRISSTSTTCVPTQTTYHTLRSLGIHYLLRLILISNSGISPRANHSLHTNTPMTNFDNNYNADLLDARADMAYQQEQAMREEYELNPEEQEMYDDQT